MPSNTSLPVVITKKGRPAQKTKLSFTSQTAINSQKKIDQLNRNDETRLATRYSFYDLEMIICETRYKKDRMTMKRQISDYQKLVQEHKRQKERTSGKIFITEPTFIEERQSPNGKPSRAISSNQSLEAIGSVRRKTKPIQCSSVAKELDDLERLQDKHLKEYADSITEMQQLEKRVGMQLSIRLPKRSYPPFTVATPVCSILTSMQNKIKYSENQLRRTQQRYKDLSARYDRSKMIGETSAEDEAAMDDKHKELLKDTFKMFCEKKSREITSKEANGLEDDPLTELPEVSGNLQRRKSVKFDLVKMKQDGNISVPMLHLLSQNSRNARIEIVENPFDSGIIPPQTRSRLLLESKKDDTMHTWLGFKTRAEMEKALKENPSQIKQIPAALLAVIEDADEDENIDLDKQEFSDTDTSGDEEDDPRFRVFDEDKVKGRKRKVKAQKLHTT